MAYLGDIEYNQENLRMLKKNGKSIKGYKIKEVEIEGSKKKFIKGGPLLLYPTGMRIYRKSKGIKEPEIIHGIYKFRKKIVGDSEPYYKGNIEILDDFSKELNNILYDQYNKNKNII